MRTCITIPQSQMGAFMAFEVVKLRFEVKPQPEMLRFPNDTEDFYFWYGIGRPERTLVPWLLHYCPYSPGQLLAVREAWTRVEPNPEGIILRSECCNLVIEAIRKRGLRWRSAATMPIEFSRSKARVVTVKVKHRQAWDYIIEAVKEE